MGESRENVSSSSDTTPSSDSLRKSFFWLLLIGVELKPSDANAGQTGILSTDIASRCLSKNDQ